MTVNTEETRLRNPFHNPLVTELIDDPGLYQMMFSERILVGATLGVFLPTNVVLVGPQGSGKSMILNLIRQPVLGEWIAKNGRPPAPIQHADPFFGISVNLVRANFHAFGRRSVSRYRGLESIDFDLEATCAADFLNHYLFREFLKGIEYILSPNGSALKSWLGIGPNFSKDSGAIGSISSWDCWFGYYRKCKILDDFLLQCERRLSSWRSFLNTNEGIPDDIWDTKSTLGDAQHAMGNLLGTMLGKSGRLPLFVVIDQYGELPELNPTHGRTLQKVINSLIKARDPVAFYKIGARSYEWGSELRVWGAESRIEIQRDYIVIDLSDVLMRNEDSKGWLFPDFAKDVAHKRIEVEGRLNIKRESIEGIFGKWRALDEADLYFPKSDPKPEKRKMTVIRGLTDKITVQIRHVCGKNASSLDLRLASAWALQRQQRGISETEILRELRDKPWTKMKWWRKERIEVALLQIASVANQKRRYFGWETVVYLSGGNITAFLLICAEIWDMATKMDFHPLDQAPVEVRVQTEGILVASEKWRVRDRNESLGGRKRYEVLSQLGPAIQESLIGDLAISNPGHSGFSLRETDLGKGEEGDKVREFLENGVNWAVLEERQHTSKQREGAARRKWYLHPLLCATFGIPFKRVKEPLYVGVSDVYNWIRGDRRIRFGKVGPVNGKGFDHKQQLRMPFGEAL
ncbi:MAG: ORC-CDC6 family AAA ATPase [Terriglobia bacterium]